MAIAEKSIVTEAEQPQVDYKDVYKVAQWKWGLDAGTPLWKRLFFRWIFLPFQSFSFQIGIPTPKEVVVESDERGRVRRTFRWWEDEGIFEHPDQADAGCLEEHWGYTNLPYGRLMPSQSGQYGVTIFPRKKNPRKSRQWATFKSTFIHKDRRKEEQEKRAWAECLRKLNQVLDR